MTDSARPKISIITAVRNGVDHIAGCIQNVIDQHCPGAEHVIVDGASKDGTVDVIRSYAAQHPSIRWISEPDRSQSDAFNKAIAMARAEVMGILNVDDFYEPGVLNRIVEIFADKPVPTFVAGNCNILDEHGRLIRTDKPSNLSLTDMLIGMAGHPVNPAAYFYHTALHKMVGGYKVDELQAEDLDFLFRAFRVSNSIYFDELWGNWRFYPGTITYENEAAGKIPAIIESVRQRHIDRLPFLHRRAVLLARKMCRFRWGRSVYYHAKKPGEGFSKTLKVLSSFARPSR
jgi:glycosyltransferase involved in cell wall biosynthesis